MEYAPEVDIGRLCRGDKPAWDAFVERYSAVIYAAVQRSAQASSGRADAEDTREAVQEVFVRLIRDDYRLLQLYDPSRSSLTTWLSVIARSTAVDYFRRRKPGAIPLDRVARQVPAPETPGVRESHIPAGLLSPRQRIVLHLMFDWDMSVPDIAEVLRVDEQTVRSTKHKALKKLRRYFQTRGSS